MKNRNLLLELVFIAVLPLSIFGCYTQIAERTTEGGTAIRNERALPQGEDRDVNARNSDPDARNVEDDNYAEGDEDVPPEFGLKAGQYNDDWYSETEYADGKTVINNFYYDGYYRTNPWYGYRYRPGWRYDSYYWDP